MKKEPNPMRKVTLRVAGCAVVLILTICPSINAATVTLSMTNGGGGLFQYAFTINGLLVEGGNTVFGLDLSSTISAPTGWDFLTPLPPFAYLSPYFSLPSPTDPPIHSSPY